jgi:predicted DNA-binding transcriptional regulator YafY
VLGALREAIDTTRKVALVYHDAGTARTERTIRPLGLFFWGPVWSCVGWCELREDFRSFRLDRIERYDPLRDTFPVEPGKTLDDFFRRIEAEDERM